MCSWVKPTPYVARKSISECNTRRYSIVLRGDSFTETGKQLLLRTHTLVKVLFSTYRYYFWSYGQKLNDKSCFQSVSCCITFKDKWIAMMCLSSYHLNKVTDIKFYLFRPWNFLKSKYCACKIMHIFCSQPFLQCWCLKNDFMGEKQISNTCTNNFHMFGDSE